MVGGRAGPQIFEELSAIIPLRLVSRLPRPPPSRVGLRRGPQARSGGANGVPGVKKWVPGAVSGRAEVVFFTKK